MAEKIAMYLFILSVILCAGIIGGFSEDMVESNSHVRRKRVLNFEPGGDVPVAKENASFVVNIRHSPNNHTICVGAILSRYTVITAASIIALLEVGSIKLRVGSGYSYRGEHYDVIARHMHFGNHPHNEEDGIALLIVAEPFIFKINNLPIALHTGVLLAGTPATIFGWGCNPTAPRGTNFRLRLRSITLPIMRHQDCVNSYRNRAVISDIHLCTYDENKGCGHTDTGAPLVVDNQLAGIYIWTRETPGHINPDVFIFIQHAEYSQWIRNNIV